MLSTTSQKATKTVTRKQCLLLGSGPPPRAPRAYSLNVIGIRPSTSEDATNARPVSAEGPWACGASHRQNESSGRPGCMPTCQASARPNGSGRGAQSRWEPGANPQPPDRSASDVVHPMADVQPNQVIGPRPSSGTQGSSGTRPPVEVAQLSARPRTEAGGLPNKVNQLPPNEGPPTITTGSLRYCSLVQSSFG